MGPASAKTIAIAAATFAACARAESPFPVAFEEGDLRLALEESAPSFHTPDFRDYLTARAAAFRAGIPERLVTEFDEAAPGDGDATGNEAEAEYDFVGVDLSGGTAKRAELYGFYGVEWKTGDAAASVRDTRAASGDGVYDNNFARVTGEGALSDDAGTTVGFVGVYENARSKPEPGAVGPSTPGGIGPPSPPPANVASGGEAGVFFRSNLWGKAKFATLVTGTFNDGHYGGDAAGANVLTAESSYDFFWLGYKQSRGTLTIIQEDYRAGGRQRGYFVGETSIETDFPVRDRLYLSGGVAAAVYRHPSPSYYLYPLGALRFRIGGGWGYFVSFRPGFDFPTYRALYLHRDYAAPDVYRPVEDRPFALKSGVTYDFGAVLRVGAAVYENRYRELYALADRGYGAAAYYDAGRVRLRGVEGSYRLLVSRWEHFARASFGAPYLNDAPERRFPYFPDYNGTAGLTYRFKGGHAITAEMEYIGARYPAPDATRPLAPAWVPDLSCYLLLTKGLGLTAAAENVTDVVYGDVAGVPAPGRSFRAGVNFTF